MRSLGGEALKPGSRMVEAGVPTEQVCVTTEGTSKNDWN